MRSASIPARSRVGKPAATSPAARPARIAWSPRSPPALILELRRSLELPLDDIVEAVRRRLNPQPPRSGIHRCLQRHGLSARLTPQQAPAAAFPTDTPAGFIHIDVKYLPPLRRRRSSAYSLPQRRL
jgi:hypothetical protein